MEKRSKVVRSKTSQEHHLTALRKQQFSREFLELFTEQEKQGFLSADELIELLKTRMKKVVNDEIRRTHFDSRRMLFKNIYYKASNKTFSYSGPAKFS